MKITILGSGTSIPTARRAGPGLAVRVGKELLLVDPSSGSLHRMERFGVPVREIRYLILSHFHPDHTGDLVPYLFARRNRRYFPPTPLTLVGPLGLEDFYRDLLQLYGGWVRVEPELLTLHEVRDDQISFPTFKLRSLPVRHTDNSCAFRFTEKETGRVLAYSGDTDYCKEIVEICREADLALLECSQPNEEKVNGHLTPQLVAKIALGAGAGRVVLIHMYPVCANYDLISQVREGGYSGPLELAEDGLQLEL